MRFIFRYCLLAFIQRPRTFVPNDPSTSLFISAYASLPPSEDRSYAVYQGSERKEQEATHESSNFLGGHCWGERIQNTASQRHHAHSRLYTRSARTLGEGENE